MGGVRRRRSVVVLLVVLAMGTLAVLWTERREVAGAVFDLVGMRRVEAHADEIHQAARESGVDPALLAAIMFKESRGRPNLVSSAGALGLMQLMPSAAADAARKLGLPEPTEEELLNDSPLNVRLGARHLRWLLDNSEGMPLEQILVTYNAGRQKLFRWMRRHGGYEAWRDDELERAARGEETTGALLYAREAIELRDRFRDRGVILSLDALADG